MGVLELQKGVRMGAGGPDHWESCGAGHRAGASVSSRPKSTLFPPNRPGSAHLSPPGAATTIVASSVAWAQSARMSFARAPTSKARGSESSSSRK